MTGTADAAAVTGLGAVTGFGHGTAAFWAGLRSGATSIGEFGGDELFDPRSHRTGVAAAVDLGPHRSLGRADRFAISAVDEAVAQAFGAREALPRETGVFFGSSTGALLRTERVMDRILDRRTPLPLRWLATQQHNGPGDTAARHLRVGGPVMTITSACASSTMALAAALDAIRCGEVEVAIAGGSDELSQLTYAGFNSLRAVDPQPTRPFRKGRKGLSLGEGAGVLLLESADHARRRGARILGWLAGAASSCDAHHMSAPLADGSGAARAMRGAIRDAGLGPADIDFLNVHGTGTPQNDRAEWQAITAVFGERAGSVPISATKSATGHLLGASGGIEAVATLLCLQNGEVPGSPDTCELDPALPVDLVLGAPRVLDRALAALSTNLAFGGANSALVLLAAGARPGGGPR